MTLTLYTKQKARKPIKQSSHDMNRSALEADTEYCPATALPGCPQKQHVDWITDMINSRWHRG